MMTMNPTRRLAARTLCVLLVAAVAVVVGPVPTRAAAVGPSLRAGLGYRLHGGDFVGYYLTSAGDRVYCLDPRKAAPRTVSLATVSTVAGESTGVTEELEYALSRWGNARNSRDAAVESQVVNSIVGNVADVKRRMAGLPKAIATDVTAHLSLARRLHGPYRVELHLRGGTAGQSELGSLRVVAASGHLVPSAVVSLRGSTNVSVPTKIRTQASGVGEFRYRVLDGGEVRVSAAAVLPGTTVRSSHPTSGQQRMVTGTGATTSRATAAFTQRFGGFSNAYSCTSECAGAPVVHLTACAPASALTSRIEYRVGRTVRTVTYAASRVRTCHTLAVRLHDRDQVSALWRYRTAHGWSHAAPAPGTFTVDCPPVPDVAVSMVADCSTASVQIALARRGPGGTWTSLVNDSRHRMVLVIGGATTRTVVALPGDTARFSATASCASPATYTFRAGVQRSTGGVNYGALGSITVP